MAQDFTEKSAARQWVWDRLAAEGVARFPFPPHGRIPNFAGAEVAAARLLEIEPWKSPATIKVNPDSPQRPFRAEALRGGFKKLDPRRIPPDKIEEAASLSRGNLWSEEVALADMPELGPGVNIGKRGFLVRAIPCPALFETTPQDYPQ